MNLSSFVSGAALLLCVAVPGGAEPDSASAGPVMERVIPQSFPHFRDDGPIEMLAAAARQSLAYYKKRPAGELHRFGEDAYTTAHMIYSVQSFLSLIERAHVDFYPMIDDMFLVYKAGGLGSRSSVTYSAYYEHSLEASLERTDDHRHPLYGKPGDLKTRRDEKGAASVYRIGDDGRESPYWTRADIDGKNVLAGRGLEIAWARSPLHVYFLQVEGSGWLLLPDGTRVRVRYAAHNGRPFRSIGTYIIEQGWIPRKDFSRAALEAFFGEHPDKRRAILDSNPRYVFFQLDRGPGAQAAVGASGAALTPGRSVALDPTIFPMGAPAWMEAGGDPPVARFVFFQDTGGAIQGPGRADYFVGAGDEAEKFASQFWATGELYFLVRKTGEER